ncbi:hypothetical protein V2G26_008282 [Clonostachys chloroleuca]|uniref:Major facilitator superfamily (MFS) profile domain-containing protein n=1 Tax=Clonostachys chloroleuca TaxID=1926264 RepID=A0AA35QE19_9HYPO|nr:unnamed protein product [Clonostachys chloroleuca]
MVEDEEKAVRSAPVERTISNTDAPVLYHDADGNFNPPDRGLLAWSQVLATLLINAMCWGYPAAYGVYQLYYVETLNLPSSQVSWIGSIQIFLTFGICTVSGRLSDAGYTRHCVVGGCGLAVLGTFMVSLATKYWQIFLAQGVCTGLGLGVAFMPAITTLSSYFKRNRAFALAIAATGTSVGSIIFPSIVQYLIPKVGFPWAVRCAAFVALFIVGVANLLLKPYLPPRKAGPLVEWGAFKERTYALFTLGAFCNFYTLYFGFFYINSYARTVIGFSSQEAVSMILIANALGIPARIVVGYLADNLLGPINMYLISLCYLGTITYVWMTIQTRAAMYIFSVFYGLAVGATQGVYVGALASLTSDPQKMGTRFGMVSTLSGFATLAGPPTVGAIIDQSGGEYKWAQVWGGTLAFGAALAVFASRTAAVGLKFKARL